MEKEEMTEVELLVDIRKASGDRPMDLANWPNHGQKSIVPDHWIFFLQRLTTFLQTPATFLQTPHKFLLNPKS